MSRLTETRKGILSDLQGLKIAYSTDPCKLHRILKLQLLKNREILEPLGVSVFLQDRFYDPVKASLEITVIERIIRDPKNFLKLQGRWSKNLERKIPNLRMS